MSWDSTVVLGQVTLWPSAFFNLACPKESLLPYIYFGSLFSFCLLEVELLP